jgi:hypothetical protein
MARILDKPECASAIKEREVELERLRDLFKCLSDTQGICEKCFTLYPSPDRGRGYCYCDYESEDYGV